MSLFIWICFLLDWTKEESDSSPGYFFLTKIRETFIVYKGQKVKKEKDVNEWLYETLSIFCF